MKIITDKNEIDDLYETCSNCKEVLLRQIFANRLNHSLKFGNDQHTLNPIVEVILSDDSTYDDLYYQLSINQNEFMGKQLALGRRNNRPKEILLEALCIFIINTSNKEFTQDVFNNVILHEQDLILWLDIYKKKGNKISLKIKKLINNWFNEKLHQRMCFESGKKLKSIIKICHPIPKNDWIKGLIRYCLGYEDYKKYGNYDQIEWMEKFTDTSVLRYDSVNGKYIVYNSEEEKRKAIETSFKDSLLTSKLN